MIKVLLTGSTGFLGNYIYGALSKSTEVITLSRSYADITADLSKETTKLPSVDLVIHCAGKAHCIPTLEVEIQEFFQVNVRGTENLLNSLEKAPVLPKYFVFISSVSVYGLESGVGITEEHPLEAKDPYGISKIEAEGIVLKWCEQHHVICTILRLPLLVGKNPPGNLGAMLKAIDNGYYFNVGGGEAKKSMVLAHDVASFIPIVAAKGGIYNLTDGFHPSFEELSSALLIKKNRKKAYNMPLIIANLIASIGDLLGNKAPLNSLKIKKITSDLTFDDSKVRQLLNWHPEAVVDYLKRSTI